MRGLLAQAEREDLVETGVLLVSEIVTNALLHAGTPIDVSASFDDNGLRVEVSDGSMHLPVRRNYAVTAGTGRGLRLLEQMVDDWGVSRNRTGKTVWFRLALTDDSPAANRADQIEQGAQISVETVDVQLRNMPLLLHAAWQEHAEALLREYLLASLDEDRDDGTLDPIQVHADATDAIAILEEHVPRASLDIPGDQLMSGATDAGVSAAEVQVPVPYRSVPHFGTLDRVIEEAIDLSRQGVAMTPPTQPEIQQFRRWVCTQVADQARGAGPVAWRVDSDTRPMPVKPLDWNLSRVSSSPTPRLAADQTNQILAASPAALDVLGYDDEAALVGRRILAIIPERFRQAHVAGFTLYLLVGRRPLVGKPLVVPALRADGTEVLVEMLISVESTGDGREVFLADLKAVKD